MSYLLYLMFRYDFDVMESLEELGKLNTALVAPTLLYGTY